MQKLSKKNILFYSILVFLFLVLFIFLGLIVWTQTGSGYHSLTNWTKNKPKDSWQVKFYYGLYKKCPPYETSTQGSENTGTQNKSLGPSYQKEQIITNIGASTDKNLYHSGEQIKLNLSVKSEEGLDGVNLYIYGIKNRYSKYSIFETKNINLKENENNFEYSLELPYCNSCSGVEEGEHTIYIKIIDDQILIGRQEIKISLRE